MDPNGRIVQELVNFVREQKEFNREQKELNREQKEFNRQLMTLTRELAKESRISSQRWQDLKVDSEKRFRAFYHLIVNLQRRG